MPEYKKFTPVKPIKNGAINSRAVIRSQQSALNKTSGADTEEMHVISQAHFDCENCGSFLVYSPKSQDLLCKHCGHHYPVPTSPEPIQEYDFKSAVRELANLHHASPDEGKQTIAITQCPSCGAQFTFQEHEHAGNCPYCATPVIAGTAHARFIHPRSLLPFIITQTEAIEIYNQWIGSRWFAPSSLKKHSERDDELNGIYHPTGPTTAKPTILIVDNVARFIMIAKRTQLMLMGEQFDAPAPFRESVGDPYLGK